MSSFFPSTYFSAFKLRIPPLVYIYKAPCSHSFPKSNLYSSSKLHIPPLNQTLFYVVIVVINFVVFSILLFFRNNFLILSLKQIFNDLLLVSVDNIEKPIPTHS